MKPASEMLRAIAACGLALVLAGCGATSGPAPVDTTQVNLPPSYRFDPLVIRVPAGARVSWSNNDNFTHAVNVVSGGFPALNLRPGQSGAITFGTPGEYEYICTYHAQNMRGKVIVVGP